MPRPEHPLIVALVESYAEEIGVPRAELWAALDGKPVRPALARALAEAFAPLVRESDFAIEGLSPSRKRATLHTMHTSEIEAPNPKGGRRIRLKPWALLMAGLKAKHRTLADETHVCRRSVSSLRSFCFDVKSPAFRPPPRAIVERWRDEYGIPLDTWPRIAD